MKVNIGISEKNLSAVEEILSVILASEFTLYLKTRKFHWNVVGVSFMEYHKLFETQYRELEESIDEIAERIGKLGGRTIATMEEYAPISIVKEHPGKYPSDKEMVMELLHDHETVIVHLRKCVEECEKKYHDAGTMDFLTGLMEEHETIAWTLRRYFRV